MQETGLKLWKDPSRITPDGRTGFLLRWGITVARNEARNHVKRTGRQVALEEHPEVAGATVNMAGDPILRARIRQCLEHLQTHQQRAFQARLDDGGRRADRDLAASIGMSFDVFRQNMTRGRKALVKCLSSFNIDVRDTPMNARDRAMLIEEAATAWRPRTPDGRTLEHPAWADLDSRGAQSRF